MNCSFRWPYNAKCKPLQRLVVGFASLLGSVLINLSGRCISVTLQNFTLWYGMVIWWLCWHRTILIRNITQKQYSQFPPVHDFGKPWWGVAYVPCMTKSPSTLCLGNPVARDLHVVIGRTLAGSTRAVQSCLCSLSHVWHVVCLQHLARACSEQSRSTTVLPINHVIQMPQCLSGFVNHDYCI